MTFVITQNCCNDASCVAECPVDCIRPSPDDREAFAAAEMLYIDPDSCIDCGACMEACPVGAVSAEEDLPSHLGRFAEFNAGYFLQNPLTSAPAVPRPPRLAPGKAPLSVGIIGAGPSGSYVLEEVLTRGDANITVYDALPTPWGLLRSGVAPDHQHTKRLAKLFEKAADKSNVELRLNVHVGRDIAVRDLFDRHHAVVVATGAAEAQPWNLPGADLAGVHPAADFVAWYNGHPDQQERDVDLSGERAVIVGNGNVALDMARILLMSPEELSRTDVAEHALVKLRASKVREVVVLGRRGPLQAAYTSAEFHALAALPGVDVIIDPEDAALDPVSQGIVDRGEAPFADGLKAQLAVEYARSQPKGRERRLVFRYLADAEAVLGDSVASALSLRSTRIVLKDGVAVSEPTDGTEVLPVGLVLASVGYRGRPIPGVPFDNERGVVPNDAGRVITASDDDTAGLYVTGWIRRGAKGGLGTSRLDAAEVVNHVVNDFNAGVLGEPTTKSSDLPAVGDVVDLSGWKAIDAAELQAGREVGRPRIKLVSVDDLLAASRRPIG